MATTTVAIMMMMKTMKTGGKATREGGEGIQVCMREGTVKQDQSYPSIVHGSSNVAMKPRESIRPETHDIQANRYATKKAQILSDQ